MADKQRYQVLTACVVVPAITDDGEQIHTVYQGGVFEANPQHPRIVHNLDSGYIAEVGAKAVPGVDGAGAPVVDNKRADGTEVGAPVALNDPGVVNEIQQTRSASAAKLPEDGSAPDGRAAQQVWVEYLARKGYSYDELIKQDKAELQKLAKQS